MNRPLATRQTRRPAGFTLVELLVVIGIIVILMGIILPAAGRVRIQAQNIASMARIKAVHGAIIVYQQSQGNRAPGLFSNAQLAVGVPVPGGRNLTQTENMVISLVGGTNNVNGNPTQVQFDPARVGQAVSQFGPTPDGRRALNAADVKTYLGNNVGGYLMTNAVYPENIGGDPTNPDTAMPEFIDAFPEPRAILYLRANSLSQASGNRVAGNMSEPNPSNAFFNASEFLRYRRTVAGEFPGDFCFSPDFPPPSGNTDFFPNAQTYLGLGNATTPRNTSYVLMGAGPDRIFGTRDDLIFP